MLVNPLATAENYSLLVHEEVAPLLLSLSYLPRSLILLSQHGREGRKVKKFQAAEAYHALESPGGASLTPVSRALGVGYWRMELKVFLPLFLQDP